MKTKIKPSLTLKSDERFLFEKLPDVLRLESAMVGIREKYLRFWDDICRRVRSEHPALKFFGNHATSPRDGQVGIGRDCWLSEWARWPSGFYIWGIDFESLCSPDAGTPCAGIWLQPPERMRIDLASFKKPIRRKAEEQLERELVDDGDSRSISLWYDLPEYREELLHMLVKKQETKFANCMGSHFGQLARLVPVIDKMFASRKKQSRHP